LIVYASQLFGGNVYRSIDGGNNWSVMESSPGSPITDLAADPIESGKLYATIGSYSENSQLFVSINAGETWSNITADLPQVPTNSVAISPYNNNEIYVANDFGVWLSINGGETYESYRNGLPAAIVVSDIHYYAPDSTVRIGTYGRGYWRVKGREAVFADLGQNKVVDLPFIYPNPSQNQFFLSESIGVYGVYDQSGNQILKQSKLGIDLTGYSAGIYIIVSATFQHKLVKL
jgi:photosystem II stability/assembly factor-like uncharacterized protein